MINKWRIEIEFTDGGSPSLLDDNEYHLLKRDIRENLEHCLENVNNTYRYFRIKKIGKEKV